MTRQQYTTQLDSILGMLSHGHNSVRLEAHTLPLWGVTVGILIGFTGLLADALTPHIINSSQERNLFIQIYIACIVMIVIAIDCYLIVKSRQKRDESISPLQRKINNINWLVCGSGVMIMMYAAQNLPGSHELFGLYIVLSGFCLYVFGLFSYSWYRWTGIIQMLLGICALFLLKNYTMKIYAATSFIIGCTLIHVLDHENLNTKQLVVRSFTWVAAVWLVAGIAVYANYKLFVDSDHLPVVALAEYTEANAVPLEPVVVSLPKGTEIPFEYLFEFDLFNENLMAQWTMQLKQPVDIVVYNGRPTGIYRVGDNAWRRRQDSLVVSNFTQQFYIDPDEGPSIRREVTIETNRNYPGLNL